MIHNVRGWNSLILFIDYKSRIIVSLITDVDSQFDNFWQSITWEHCWMGLNSIRAETGELLSNLSLVKVIESSLYLSVIHSLRNAVCRDW